MNEMKLRALPSLGALALFATLPACTALVEGTLAGRGSDAGTTDDVGMVEDAGGGNPCMGMMDGLRCTIDSSGDPYLCVRGICQMSHCGDRVRDDRLMEACDDGNDFSGDGCEADCTFTCTMASQCVDMESCNGVEHCGPEHTCEPGADATDGDPCTVVGTSTSAMCHGGVCRAGMCGDGVMDAGEQCDDHNVMDGDGCDADCTFTCTVDADCQDGNLCNGSETCDAVTNRCSAAMAPLACDDMDMCTNDSCDMTMGCVFATRLVDADGDGHPAVLDGCGGDDCDDTNGARFPGNTEVCGATVDNNCDGMVGAPPTWYRDCDGDGFAAQGATPTPSCTMPAPSVGCVGWTSTAPTILHTNVDCMDATGGGSAYPGQDDYFTTGSGASPPFDYDCSGSATLEIPYFDNTTAPNPPSPLPRNFVTCHTTTLLGRQICTGDSFWRQASAPACGASGTQAYCGFFTNILTRVTTCQYLSRTAVAACH